MFELSPKCVPKRTFIVRYAATAGYNRQCVPTEADQSRAGLANGRANALFCPG
jgi:hypothetical protein